MIIGNGLRLELAQRSLHLCGFHLHRALLLLGSLLQLVVWLGITREHGTRVDEWILCPKSTCPCGPRPYGPSRALSPNSAIAHPTPDVLSDGQASSENRVPGTIAQSRGARVTSAHCRRRCFDARTRLSGKPSKRKSLNSTG